RRGITIDLGFAPLPLADAVQASIVDVPGHEAFVKNMLAGATGIDVALLVVAADEGTMPQTEEHLAILELLGVQRGIPVIAKADLVDREWLELVRAELVRGHVAVTGPGWAATSVLEAAVELLPGAPRPIAARTRLRVHHGTAVVLARAVPARPIAPGERGPVRLMLETPLVARGGDRF